PAGGTAAHARISPAARRRARELGVSLEELARSAAGGVAHIEDVEQLAARKPVPPADARAAMRSTIGAAMARAKREIPHYYLGHSLDFQPARDWLVRHNEQLPVKDRLIEAVLITKAVALAASRIEGFNGYFRDGRFEPSPSVHAGAAIAVRGGGLLAPALLDADRKDLATLMRDFSDLVTRVRAGHLRSGEFSAATITITSLGVEGVDVLYPIINPPQVAIVGAGAIRRQPWVQDGQLVVRPVLMLALAGDHRVTDGRVGARFLRAVADLLAHPEAL
ncbi:MAG: 2-oxo acid dehydrogenase subunit E2, partial [Gammaproteobacteria bacterium]|nr:2-oxo acid dehydrogenase subunit E2 [Gammaproteobacteria bacterium]